MLYTYYYNRIATLYYYQLICNKINLIFYFLIRLFFLANDHSDSRYHHIAVCNPSLYQKNRFIFALRMIALNRRGMRLSSRLDAATFELVINAKNFVFNGPMGVSILVPRGNPIAFQHNS
jgi:hypothetical protein